MKLSISYIFPPAQEFAVRVAVAAEEQPWQQSPVWVTDCENSGKHRVNRHKHRERPKYRRLFLQLEMI